MSQEVLSILYLGDSERAQQLQAVFESAGIYVYAPHTLLETLAMTVTYWPDLIILDTTASPLTEQAALHLQTIDVEPLIVSGEQELIHVLSDQFPFLEFSTVGVLE